MEFPSNGVAHMDQLGITQMIRDVTQDNIRSINHSKKTDYPKITLVTPSYNQVKFLKKCIHSVLSQKYPNLEYIIMDGGSTDGSKELIESYSSQLAYWRSEPDDGHYAAIQEGFDMSTGEIMGWINSDDLLHTNGLFHVAAAFMENPDIRFVTGRTVGFTEIGAFVEGEFPLARWCRDSYLNTSNFAHPPRFITQEATYWKRSLWEEAGAKLDTNFDLAGDHELWARFLRYAPLHTVNAKIGGFRSHSEEQRSRVFWNEYIQQASEVIRRERQLQLEEKDFHSTPREVLELKDTPSFEKPVEIITKKNYQFKNKNVQQPKIQLVTLAYDDKSLLQLTADSVLSQAWPNLEYTIIDIDSSKESLQMLKPFAKFCNIVKGSSKKGIFNQLTRVLNSSNAEIMSWAPINVIYNEHSFSTVDEIFNLFPDVEWINGRSYGNNTQGEQTWFSLHMELYNQYCHLAGNYIHPFIHQESIFWKRSLWKKAGAYIDAHYSHSADIELWYRFFRHAKLHPCNFLLAGKIGSFQGVWERNPIVYHHEARKIIDRELARSASDPYLTAGPADVIV